MSVDVLSTSPEAWDKIHSSLEEIFRTRLKPPPDLNLVEWADTHRYLPDNSAESGRWKTSRVEVARQPMLSITQRGVQEVTVMCCIQLMKTELMINTGMYYMHQEPSPIMYVAPKKETAEAWSKERLVKSVNETPALKGIFGSGKSEGNTILQKQFPGGQISIVSARNPTDLAMRAVMVLLFDEIDKYPMNVGSGEGGSGGEGDPISVAWGRATTYGKRAKKICACSPTIHRRSRIEQEYENSNMSVFFQMCQHCGHSSELSWSDVHIPKLKDGKFDHRKAAIVCSDCGTAWSEGDRLNSIRQGHWVAKRPEITWHHGYKVSALASPFIDVCDLAKEFSDAQGDPERLKAFTNTRLAETWKESGDAPDWNRLYERREAYQIGIVPEGGLMLVAAIDVQKDYCQWEVIVFGRKKESWSIDKGIIEGEIQEQEVKEKIYELCDSVYKNHLGVEMAIEAIAIDSSAFTMEVYSTVREYGSNRFVAIKGMPSSDYLIGTPKPMDINLKGKRIVNGVKMWPIGTHRAKEQVYRWLKANTVTDEQREAGRTNPTGYCHFPQWEQEYFEQLCAEELVEKKDRKGFATHEWIKTRERNEQLDLRVYCLAMAYKIGIDRMSEKHWEERERFYGYSKPIEKQLPATQEATEDNRATEKSSRSEQQLRRHRRKGSWIKR